MKAARQKHRGDFESMFNRGNGRLYLGKGPISDATLNAQIGALSGKDIQGQLSGDARINASDFTGSDTIDSLLENPGN